VSKVVALHMLQEQHSSKVVGQHSEHCQQKLFVLQCGGTLLIALQCGSFLGSAAAWSVCASAAGVSVQYGASSVMSSNGMTIAVSTAASTDTYYKLTYMYR
jgi:hypothetical protein